VKPASHNALVPVGSGRGALIVAELKRLAASGKEVVVVSACLCGIRCRFDGRDKRMDEKVAAAVGDGEALPLCPEVLAGFGTPRPAISFSADAKQAHDHKGQDVTATLEAGARLADLFAQEAGAKRALLKERSPSCGVKAVFGPDGVMAGEGRFTARLKKRGLAVLSEEE